MATIPVTVIKVGAGQFAVPQLVPDNANGYKITVNQVAWPFTGGRAVTFSMEVSLDGGQSYQSMASFDVDDVQQGGGPFPNSPPLGTFVTTAPLPHGTGRLLRVSWVVLKQISISGQVDVF